MTLKLQRPSRQGHADLFAGGKAKRNELIHNEGKGFISSIGAATMGTNIAHSERP